MTPPSEKPEDYDYDPRRYTDALIAQRDDNWRRLCEANDRLTTYEDALRRIVGEDWRGNEPNHIAIARAALAETSAGGTTEGDG